MHDTPNGCIQFVKIPQQQMEAQLAASQQQTQAATLQVALITWRAAAQLAASQRQTEAATRQVVEIMDQAAAQLAASQRQMETRLVALREEFAAARRRETHSARQHTAAQARVGRRAPKRANGVRRLWLAVACAGVGVTLSKLPVLCRELPRFQPRREHHTTKLSSITHTTRVDHTWRSQFKIWKYDL